MTRRQPMWRATATRPKRRPAVTTSCSRSRTNTGYAASFRPANRQCFYTQRPGPTVAHNSTATSPAATTASTAAYPKTLRASDAQKTQSPSTQTPARAPTPRCRSSQRRLRYCYWQRSSDCKLGRLDETDINFLALTLDDSAPTLQEIHQPCQEGCTRWASATVRRNIPAGPRFSHLDPARSH